MSKANIPIGPGLVNPSHDQDETLTKCPSPDKMSDSQLVNYIGRQFTKFLLEMRPYLIEVHTRFIQKRAAGRPFLGYTDWDKFCPDFFNYTGRHVRRIINGEGLPKPRKTLPLTTPKRQTVSLSKTAVWTDHDFIHKCAQSIKEILQPLESDPPRYAKVADAIAEEITGDASVLKRQQALAAKSEEMTEKVMQETCVMARSFQNE